MKASDLQAGQTDDRVFTDWGLQHFEDRMRASAEKKGGRFVIVRMQCVGPTKKPYVSRHGGMTLNGKLIAFAYANRRGAIRWSTLVTSSMEIEANHESV